VPRLPVPIRRPRNLIQVPAVARALPWRRLAFLHGSPEEWAPTALAAAEEVLPWVPGADYDALLAPAPEPGDGVASLRAALAEVPPATPVVLYERDVPVWPNLLVHDGGDGAAEPATPAEGLRAYRSAFRHGGRGLAEAYQVLDARRLDLLLSGRRPPKRGPLGDLVHRRFLVTAHDHQRALEAVASRPGPDVLPPARRVLVLSPHYDDESLQAGGAMLAAMASGAEVRVVWLTDGARGVPDASPEESARIRRAEGEAAMRVLGVSDLHFLGAPEERLRARGPWRRRLHDLIAEFDPDRIHLVWWADDHVDHYEVSRLLRAALPTGYGDVTLAVCGVWAPLPGRALLPLDAGMRRRKDEAVRAYRSQLAAVDYLRVEHGLARWHARDRDGADYAESFWVLPAADYLAAFRASGADRRLWLG